MQEQLRNAQFPHGRDGGLQLLPNQVQRRQDVVESDVAGAQRGPGLCEDRAGLPHFGTSDRRRRFRHRLYAALRVELEPRLVFFSATANYILGVQQVAGGEERTEEGTEGTMI